MFYGLTKGTINQNDIWQELYEMNRSDRLRKLIFNKNIDAVIISEPYNIRYLCGFSGGEGYLYISETRKCMLVDSRYTLWAKKECTDTEVVTVGHSYYDMIRQFIKEDGVNKLALEGDHLTYDDFSDFEKNLPECDIISLGSGLKNFRAVKDEYEILMIAKAEEIGDKAFDYILGELKPGVTEKEIALKLEMYMRSHGAEALSFPVIAASGKNSASPHAIPSDKELEYGDFITMDFGCVYNGYCSDMTRTVVIGKAESSQKEIYDIVLSAQNEAIERIHAGMTGAEADSIARDIITNAGYGSRFGHGLGHSVGLYIHESPRLSKLEKEVLMPGMVVTVEPGIYIEDMFGVRIEDVIVIKDNGVYNLTHSDKNLIEV